MAFMQEDIRRDFGYCIETESGTEYLPSEVCGNLRIRGEHDEDSPRFEAICEAVRTYCEGTKVRSIGYVPCCYWARMSAPGFLDCTPWTPYGTLREAREALRESFGEVDED